MSKVLIGYGYTNENGVATMDYDANGNSVNGYTGSGAGLVDLVAEVEVDDGTVESNTYEVMDYIAFDNGIDGDCSDIWTGDTSDLSRTSEGSLFSSTSARLIKNSVLISGDFEATFEAKTSTSSMWGVTDANNNRTRYYLQNDTEFEYYKIRRVNGVFTAQKSTNGTNWTNLTAQSSDVTSGDCYFMFQNNSGTKSLTFKNLKIYPI